MMTIDDDGDDGGWGTMDNTPHLHPAPRVTGHGVGCGGGGGHDDGGNMQVLSPNPHHITITAKLHGSLLLLY